jgi:hypothetical protein
MIPGGAAVPIDRARVAGGFLHGAGTAEFTDRLFWTVGTIAVQQAVVGAQATLEILGDGIKTLTSASFDNFGAASSSGSGPIWLNQGAVLRNRAGASFHATSSFFDSPSFPPGTFRNQGEFVADGETTFFRTQFVNDGGVVHAASGNLQFQNGYTQTAGVTRLGGGTITSVTPLDIQGGVLEGAGHLQGSLRNGGQVVIDDRFEISGSYTQTATSQLTVVLGGAAHGELIVQGTAQLNGGLSVDVGDGFAPSLGESYGVVTAVRGIMGLFAGEQLPPLPGGLYLDVVYQLDRVRLDVLLAGDVDGNGELNVADIDGLAAAIRGGSLELRFDVNRDGSVDFRDHEAWVSQLKHTYFGDSNLDGEFGSGDLVEIFTAGKYETGQEAGWGDGDWDGSGVFDSRDLIVAFVEGGYEKGPRATVASVPEPPSIAMFLMALLATLAVGSRAPRARMP